MVQLDGLAASNMSKVRTELVEASIWVPWGETLNPVEVSSRLPKAFPAVEPHVHSAGSPLMATHAPTFLVEAGLHQQALDYVGLIAALEPPDYPSEAQCTRYLVDCLNDLYAWVLPKIGEEGWIKSNDRAFLNDVIPIVGSLQCVGGPGQPAHGLRSVRLASALYEAQDLELFDAVRIRLEASEQPFIFSGVTDPFVSARHNDLQVQEAVLQLIASRATHWNPIMRNEFIVKFWKGAQAYTHALAEYGDKGHWRGALDIALTEFNMPNLKSSRELVRSKQMFTVMSAMADMLLAARSEGVNLYPNDYRNVLKPLEEVAKHAGRNWKGAMGDSYSRYESVIRELLDDQSPDDLFKRKLPAPLVNNLCMMLTNKHWIDKTDNKGRRSIIQDDFCL